MKWISILCLLFVGFCKSQDKTMCGKITHFKNRVYIDGKQLVKSNELFCANQTIETKLDSAAIVQFSDYAVLTIKQNSKLRLIKAKNLDPHRIYVNLQQIEGSSFSRIVPNKADYFLSTSIVVINVAKGKTFEVINTDKQTEIKTYQSVVTLRRPKTSIPIDDERWRFNLPEKQKAIATKTQIETPKFINADEAAKLKMMSQIGFGQLHLSTFAIQNLPKDSTTLVAEPEKKFMTMLTLEDVKKIYGNVNVIRLRNGHEYVGAIKQDGKRTLILTPTQNFYVSTTLIEATEPYAK